MISTEQTLRMEVALMYRPERGMYLLEAIVHAPEMRYEATEVVVGRWPAGETIGDELPVQLHIHRKAAGTILGQFIERPVPFESEITASQLAGRSGIVVFVIEDGVTRAQRELPVTDPSAISQDRRFETAEGHEQWLIAWDESLPWPTAYVEPARA